MRKTTQRMFISQYTPKDEFSSIQTTQAFSVESGETVVLSFNNIVEETKGRRDPIKLPFHNWVEELDKRPYCVYTVTFEINSGNDPKGWDPISGLSHKIIPQYEEDNEDYAITIEDVPDNSSVRAKVARTAGEDTIHSVDIELYVE